MLKLFRFFVLSFFVLSLSACGSSPNKIIKEQAELFNKQCPIKIDYLITLDKVEFESPKTIVYYYTANLNSIKTDAEAIKEALKLNIDYTIINNESFQTLKSEEAIFKFVYKTQDGKDFFEYTLEPKVYLDKELTNSLKSLSDDQVYNLILQTSGIHNSQLPRQIAEGVEITQVNAIKPRTLEFVYRLLATKDQIGELDPQRYKDMLSEMILSKKSEDILLKDNKVNFRFSYYDINNEHLLSVDITADDYNK